MAKRADKLKKMGMPKKPMAEEEAEMDLDLEGLALGGDEDMLGEEGAEDELLMDDEMSEEGPLAEFSDEELMEEMKARGLELTADEEAEEEEDEEMLDEEEEDLA